MSIDQNSILQHILPKKGNYLFEKTDVTEVAPRPTLITYSLLMMIYAQNGPVDNVYRKYKVKYTATNFFLRIGDELYIDREKELKTLLPAYTYFGDKELNPHMSSIKGSLTTLKNIFYLNQISAKNQEQVKEVVTQILLRSVNKDESMEDALKHFLKDYEVIFEINIITSKVIERFKKFLDTNNSLIPLVNFLQIQREDISGQVKIHIKEVATFWKGNSLEFVDESAFVPVSFVNDEEIEIKEWIKTLPKENQHIFHQQYLDLKNFLSLRYIGSLVTIKHINILRKRLLLIAQKNNFSDDKNIYFASLEEIKNHSFEEKICEQRKAEYKKLLASTFPKRISNSIIITVMQPKGVSSGIAKGVLVKIQQIENIDDDVILYTSVLSPDLVKYFRKIKGVVSEQGSMLSHAAIVAREMHIPVVVNVDLKDNAINIGDVIEIDGEMGRLKKIKE